MSEQTKTEEIMKYWRHNRDRHVILACPASGRMAGKNKDEAKCGLTGPQEMVGGAEEH